jgi:hypothetical protein
MTYLYVILSDGTWLKVTIIGKLTSTSKRLTPPVQWWGCEDGLADTGCTLGPAPDEMGVYGESSPDKVGITTLGSIIEFAGFCSFIYSEVPLSFTNNTKQIVEMKLEASPEEVRDYVNKLEQLKKEAAK